MATKTNRTTKAQQTLDSELENVAAMERKLIDVDAKLSAKQSSFGDEIVGGLDVAGLRKNIAALEGERDQLRQKLEDTRTLCASLKQAIIQDRRDSGIIGMDNAYTRFDSESKAILADGALDIFEERIAGLEGIFADMTENWNQAARGLDEGERAIWSYKRNIVRSRINASIASMETLRTILDPPRWI